MTTKHSQPLIVNEDGFAIWPPPPSAVVPFPIKGLPDIQAESAVQQWPLGTRLVQGERVFRYCKAGGTALAVGKMMQAVVPLAGRIDEVIDEPAVGAFVISFTPAVDPTDNMAANEFADGWLFINDDTGEGYLYRIKSHPAITGAVAGNITLWDPIKVAPGANATATVLHNKYRNVIVTPSSGPTARVVGVTPIAVTANYYFWLQTKGPATVLINGTVIIGAGVMPSDAIAGAVEHWVPETDTAGEVESMGPVGSVLVVVADTEYGLIDLALE